MATEENEKADDLGRTPPLDTHEAKDYLVIHCSL